jgi:hypothetical protein
LAPAKIVASNFGERRGKTTTKICVIAHFSCTNGRYHVHYEAGVSSEINRGGMNVPIGSCREICFGMIIPLTNGAGPCLSSCQRPPIVILQPLSLFPRDFALQDIYIPASNGSNHKKHASLKKRTTLHHRHQVGYVFGRMLSGMRRVDLLGLAGTSSIVHETTHQPLLSILSSVVETIVHLRTLGHKVVVVSSGAIGVGLQRMALPRRPKGLSKKQVCTSD